MAIPKRNVIVFQSDDCENEVTRNLSSLQWNVNIAINIDQVSSILSNHRVNVGLCLIGQRNDNSFLAQMNRLFNLFGRLNWIIGLPKECLQDTFTSSLESKLISEYCFDYLTLPIDMERLVFSLGHADGMAEMVASTQNGDRGVATSVPCYGIIGNSPAMLNLFKSIEKTYHEDCSVYIEGETGTGKELVANAIHFHSSRSGNPLIALNCGAFPKDLIQAELFGYEKGAFTGALQQKIGRIESAQGGTLFLDEIGDLPLDQQANLLRFLEDREITRIGGLVKIPVDVRIISATHVDLGEAVKKGTFRKDLYYRLRVIQLKTPPLRERENDIELLARYFFNKFTANHTKYKARGFNSDALKLMRLYDWPGNVRELINCIRQAIVMSENQLLTPADLDLERRYKLRSRRTLEEARALTDRELIIASLYESNNNISYAAELLGITRTSLYRLINKYNLQCGTTECSLCTERGRCRWSTPQVHDFSSS